METKNCNSLSCEELFLSIVRHRIIHHPSGRKVHVSGWCDRIDYWYHEIKSNCPKIFSTIMFQTFRLFCRKCSGKQWGHGADWSEIPHTILESVQLILTRNFEWKDLFFRHKPAQPPTSRAIHGCVCFFASFPPISLKPSALSKLS